MHTRRGYSGHGGKGVLDEQGLAVVDRWPNILVAKRKSKQTLMAHLFNSSQRLSGTMVHYQPW